MKISVINTFTDRKATTENSEILSTKIRIKDDMMAGFIKGIIIFHKIFLYSPYIKAASSKRALKLFNEAEIIIIANGVKIIVRTNITPQIL